MNFQFKFWNFPGHTEKCTFIGLTGAQSLQDRWFAYQSIVYAPSLKRSKTTNPNEKTKFSTIEIGVGYALDTKTQLTIGYRSQTHTTTEKLISGERKAKLDGVIFGGAYSF